MLTRSKRDCFVRWFDDVNDEFWREFKRKRIAVVRSLAPANTFGRESVIELCKYIQTDLKDTFSVEFGDAASIDPSVMNEKQRRSWYVSFIVQKDRTRFERLVKCLPLDKIQGDCTHSNAVWIFMGQNLHHRYLDGRAEHTDSLSDADATWHLQTRGTKMWYVRPSSKLLKTFDQEEDLNFWRHTHRICLEMQRGDLLLIDTQMWWHHTKIPSTVSGDRVSLSYARDVCLSGSSATTTTATTTTLTNIDCVYASNDILCGDVVLTEHDLPDCELASSSTPNCYVTEDEKGMGVLVALRDIKQGEIFTIIMDEDEGHY